MKTNILIWVCPGDRVRLERLVSDRNTPQKHVWRARIVLLSGDRLGTMSIMRRVGKSKPTVWRWQARFLEEGVDGLLRDRDLGSGRPPLGAAVKAEVLTKTMGETPFNGTHWSVRTMARAVGISHTSVQRIWAEEAAFGVHFQAVERSQVCRESGGHYRALSESAGQGAGSFS